MENSKIWLCGIVQNSQRDVNEMTKYLGDSVDGLIFVCSEPTNDGTLQTLLERKGKGEIISLPWMENHSWSMNGFLNSRLLQPNDWFIVLDASERLNLHFAFNLREMVKQLEIRNINAIYHYSKLVMARYNSSMFFTNSPHWGLQGVRQHFIRLEDSIPNPRDCIYSTRNNNRPADHSLNHFLKYYLNKVSNHLLLGREGKEQEFLVHEEVRNKFRLHCLDILKINPLNVENLTEYCKNNKLDYTTAWFFNYEEILNSWYCYRILNHPLQDIRDRQVKKELFKIE